MRLYRFTNASTDAIVVTDGIEGQNRIFITETTRYNAVSEDIDAKKSQFNFESLGFVGMVGEVVMHEEIVAFAKSNNLKLVMQQEGVETVLVEENAGA